MMSAFNKWQKQRWTSLWKSRRVTLTSHQFQRVSHYLISGRRWATLGRVLDVVLLLSCVSKARRNPLAERPSHQKPLYVLSSTIGDLSKIAGP
jgi:hypothetical protein